MNSYENINMINCGVCNCYVVRGSSGDVLIDTGSSKYRNEIEMWLLNYDIKLILITHAHNDHIGNAKYFSDIFNAPVAMSGYDMLLARNNLLHTTFSVGIAGNVIKKLSEREMSEKADLFNTDIILEDEMLVGSELGLEIKAVSLGGHTKGSFGFLHNDDLYVGDAVMNFLRPSFPGLCESPKAARQSLEKIKEIDPSRILFGHGMPLDCSDKKLYNGIFDFNLV